MLPMLKGGLGCVHVNGVMSGGVGVGGGGLAAHRFLLPVGLLVDVVVVLEAAQGLHPCTNIFRESLHPRRGPASGCHHLLEAVHHLLAQGRLLGPPQLPRLPRAGPKPLHSGAAPPTLGDRDGRGANAAPRGH